MISALNDSYSKVHVSILGKEAGVLCQTLVDSPEGTSHQKITRGLNMKWAGQLRRWSSFVRLVVDTSWSLRDAIARSTYPMSFISRRLIVGLIPELVKTEIFLVVLSCY